MSENVSSALTNKLKAMFVRDGYEKKYEKLENEFGITVLPKGVAPKGSNAVHSFEGLVRDRGFIEHTIELSKNEKLNNRDRAMLEMYLARLCQRNCGFNHSSFSYDNRLMKYREVLFYKDAFLDRYFRIYDSVIRVYMNEYPVYHRETIYKTKQYMPRSWSRSIAIVGPTLPIDETRLSK